MLSFTNVNFSESIWWREIKMWFSHSGGHDLSGLPVLAKSKGSANVHANVNVNMMQLYARHIIYIPVCWAFFCKHPRTKLPKLLEHLWTWSLRKYVNQHQCYLQSLLLQEYFSLLFICGSPQLMAHSGFSLVSGQIFVRTNLRPLKFFEKFYNWGKSRLP